MAIVQWVNLEKESDYASDPDIGSVDRCGTLTIKTAFAKPNVPLTYKVKVSPVGSDNVTYNTAELGRNGNFKMTKGAIDLGTQAEVLMSDTIKLSAAGGNKYKLEAKDGNGAVVESLEVEAKRKLYYQYMYMDDANGKVAPHPLTQLEGHCLKNHVVLTKSGTDKKIPFHKCINTTGRFRHNHLAAEVNAKYDLATPLKRVGCVTALSNYIGKYIKVATSVTHTIGGTANPNCVISRPPSPPVGITNPVPGVVSLTVLTGTKFLWYGLDDDDDNAKMWFVGGAISFTPASSSASPAALAGHSIPINKSDVTIGGTDIRTHGGRKVIDITISPGLEAMLNQSAGTIKFILDVNKVKGFSGGFSWGGGGFALTTCCTKSWFEDKLPADSDVIWNHELGHRMQMVAYGDKTNATYPRPKTPDAPASLYGEVSGVNDKGHQGPHCEKGALTYTASTKRWSGTPDCVLFGATSVGRVKSPLDYCVDCTPIVRKLDLSF